MLDLSPQIFEVMGASRRLTRFTSTCLCLLLLSLAQHLVRKSFFFFFTSSQSVSTVFGFSSFGRLSACCPVPGTGHAQEGSEPASVCPATGRARGSSHERPCWLRHRRLALVSCQEIDLPRARKIESIT